MNDLRTALRQLRRQPGFSAVVVLTLAVGLGANTAIFSLVNALLLRPLPVRDPGGLVALSQGKTGGVWGEPERVVDTYSHPLYQRLRSDGPFAGLLAQASATRCAVRAAEGEPPSEPAVGRAVSGNFFEVLGVAAGQGRALADADDTAGAEPVVVLAHGYWQRRFGGAPVVGTHLTINASRYTVVGVLPAGFTGLAAGERVDLWVPLARHAQLARSESLLDDRRSWWLQLLGRVRPGLDFSVAQAGANVVLQRFLAEGAWRTTELPDADPSVPRTARDVRIELAPGARGLEGARGTFRAPLLVLMAGVGLLLGLVCLNVGHLLLLRGARRQRELAIRVALGATRGRLARQLLTEGLVLSALGAVVGTVAARWLIDGLLLLAPGTTHLPVAADGRVWGVTLLAALAAGLLVGLAPAWQAGRASLLLRGVEGRARLGRLLLVSQVAFAAVLLVGAGLLGATLERLRATDPGVDRQHLLVAGVLPREAGLDQAQASLLPGALIGRVSALPGVRAASMSSVTGYWMLLSPSGAVSTGIARTTVTPEHLETLGVPRLRGRGFSRADEASGPAVAIVNQTLERSFFGGDAVGKRFRLVAAPERELEVVGVVGDTRTAGLREGSAPAFYVPVAQWPSMLRRVEVRAAGDPALLVGAVRAAIGEAAPGLPVGAIRTMETESEEALRPERLLVALSRAFGLTALGLVALGLLGVIGQWAARRTAEIGVRMALGATAGRVRWLVLRQALALVGAGLALGLPAAVVAARAMAGLLYGVAPLHGPTLASAALLLLGVALMAAWAPARRASRIDPMAALRSE